VPELTLEQYRLIRDLIYQVSGIYFADKKKYLLENRLPGRLRALGMQNYEDYYHFLKYDPRKASEFRALFDAITINETNFFRDLPQLTALEREILPEMIAEKSRRGVRGLKIWSAGCATGEETYTLAIIVMEVLGKVLSQWHVEILAVDISEAALQKARQGVYRMSSVRNTPARILSKYFTAKGDRYVVKDEVKPLVKYMPLNLFDHDRMRLIRGMDVIFCRNVLIYFDQESKQQVIADLYDSLNPGGYLFLGSTESLHGISKAFKLIHFPKAIGYRK